MNELIQKVTCWAEARDMIGGSDPKTQTLKLISEAGKLSRSIANKEDCRNDVGDCFVVIDIPWCLRY